MKKITKNNIPLYICGPMIRRLTKDCLVLWWISPEPVKPKFSCWTQDPSSPFLSIQLGDDQITRFQFGTQAYVHLAEIRPEKDFPCDCKIEYELELENTSEVSGLKDLMPDIVYQDEDNPSFVVRQNIRKFYHGSCRKPHHDSEDAFVGLDRDIGRTLENMEDRPAFVMLTGDQIYSDDVAGPMLQAIHCVIRLLGLYDEVFEGAKPVDSQSLYNDFAQVYARKKIIPRTRIGKSWYRRGGVKHIFTARYADNHMVSFAEWMAMYILVWSPSVWGCVEYDLSKVMPKDKQRFEKEERCIEGFKKDLPKVRRMFAHIPSYMIFDDHDITDDWNLTARWEEQAYGHPFTKRIIGNALMAYFLCQGLGNAPDKFSKRLAAPAQKYFETPEKQNHDRFIDELLIFKHWHYEVPVMPELVVVDSRTRRWKRNKLPASPSGLLDWEALMKLQYKLMQSDKVILVAPAPIFGVKLIELIQRVFTTFGYSLTVDAENWMAHRKSAYVLLEIFKNARTASQNVIISGDVHYSFAYDVELRFTDNCPGIWQITSSGIKNQFPEPLISWLDRLNQIMYSPSSLLNWFTKRRDLVIYERIPEGREEKRLINASGIGCVTLDENGTPVEIADVYADGSKQTFEKA